MNVAAPVSMPAPASAHAFPMGRWWVAGFASELTDKPVARTLLDRPMVLFRKPDGTVAALADRCCHKDLPLSCGDIEERGLRCGYHGLLYDINGVCIEIPGQDKIPSKARIARYPLREQNKLLWVWVGATPDDQPTEEPPRYPFHDDPAYQYGGAHYHYASPYQLIHDNLMDLSHVGYVHRKTIGGNPLQHMTAKFTTTVEGEVVRVVRPLPDTTPPPTYTAVWPFKGPVDRWQETEFHVSHIIIWTGAMEPGVCSLDAPERPGLHIRGFHGVTPETVTTSHYFWTVATNPHPDFPGAADKLIRDVSATFDEDKYIIEAQWQNQQRFAGEHKVDIHIDTGPNRARRIIDQLAAKSA